MKNAKPSAKKTKSFFASESTQINVGRVGPNFVFFPEAKPSEFNEIIRGEAKYD